MRLWKLDNFLKEKIEHEFYRINKLLINGVEEMWKTLEDDIKKFLEDN